MPTRQDFTSYAWERPRGGVRLVSGASPSAFEEPELFLAAASPEAEFEEIRPDAPSVAVEIDQLIRDLEAHGGDPVRHRDAESILAFAHRYGRFGVMPERVEFEIDGDSAVAVNYEAEPLTRIRFQLAGLRLAVDLLAALAAREPIERFLTVDESGKFRLSTPVAFPLDLHPTNRAARELQISPNPLLTVSDDSERLVGRWTVEERDEEAAAWALLTNMVDLRLAWHSSPRWLPVGDKPRMRQRRLIFNSPLGCAWDALALSQEWGTPPRRCPRCGTPFTQHLKSKRGHATYCSPKCQKYMARKRHDALELRTRGLGPTRISKRIGIDEKTVRGWFKAAAAKGRK